MILPDPPAPALAPPSEDDAFAALQNLEYLAAYGTAPPDEPTRLAVKALKFRQPTDRATLEAYATHRRARSLPLFPTQTAKASRERDTFLANLYTKAPEEFLPKADLDNLNAAAEASGDPENFKKGQLNRTFLSAITGKQLSGEAYALTRDLYARQHLGMTGPVTDAAFHGAMAARHAEDSTATQAALAASSAAFQQALIGEPIDRAASSAAIAALPERHRPTAQAALREAVLEANAARRRNLPAVSRIAGTVENIIATPGDAVTGATRETSLRRLIVDMAAALPDDPAERDIALAMLGKELSKLPEDDRAGLTRIWDGIQRGLNATVEGVKGLGWEAIASAAGVSEYVPDKVVRRPGFGQETINDRTKVAQLKGLIQGDALDLRKASDSFLLKASIAAAPSVPYTFLAISPYGFGVMAASLAGQSAQDSRINSPETNANARLSAAIASGVGQAVIETIFTRAALKLATGRIPTLTNLLNRAAIGSLTARGAAGALGAGAAAYGIEFTEEVAQDALDLSLQNAATELSGINANVDWRQFFTDWTPGGGAKADETLLAITPFALIAGGIAGVHQFRNGAYYLKNAALMRAAGITEPQIRSITGAASPEEAQDLLKTSFEEAQQRQAADPKERERLATYREAALADLRASNEALTRAGLPRIAQEWNDTTEEYQTVFLNPADDSRQIFDTEEEALEAWHAEINTQNEADLDALATAAEDGFIEHVMGEGQLAATGVSVQTVQREVSLASEQSAMLADVKAAREAGRRASTAAKRRAAEDALATATTRLQNLKARIEIFILDQGLTPDAAADTLKNTFIRGRVTAQRIGDAIVGQTIELFNGRTLSDVVEEFSEANLKNGILDGVVDPEIMLDDIRRYETATGRQVIAKGYAYDPANPLPLTEGFSKLARGYVFSQIRGGQLPETVRKWAEMQALIGSAILSTGSAFAADINVAGDLREAMKAGHLPPRLQRKLADSAGISESDRNYRLQKAMEEQLAAEAMGGFPEIRETLRGRLPHPNTARKQNLPLVGELQRIYDSLIRPTRRKTKDGRTIDRTNEANAYFLPEGQVESLDLVRRSLNEKGFDFTTPAEMLDALDASISYNKPQYGTFSGESYSLERTPAGQRNPTVPTNQPGGANIGDSSLPGNSVVTPEMDAAYLDAAERGDFKTSLEFVDLLATKLGFKKGPFWHVTQDQRDEMDSKIENEGKWRDESDSKYFQILGPPFEKFKSGDLIHVGDFDAAKERALNGWGASSNPYFVRVFLKFKKAIKKDDSDSSKYDERGAKALEKLGFKPKTRPPYGWGGQVSNEEFASLLDAFDEAGVDALWYKNEHEGNGGKSYAVIRPEQIFIADPIVRDEAGNIIPLSSRFNQSTPAASGESFSLATGSTLNLTPADYAARDTASHVSFSISPADLAHNARLRKPLGVLAAVADQYGNKPDADPILYRPGRFYRVIDEAALADFRASGILRPNPDPDTTSGRAYERLFASEGAPSSRYRGRYIVEIDPARAGDWQPNADASGYHSAAIGSITADSALRIYDTATRSTVIDNLGDEAFLPMAAGESYSVAINMPRTTQESRTIAGPAPVADLTAKPLRAFTQMFQSAPGEPGDLSPRGDGGTDTSFSLSRQQETYEQAKKNVSESSARLRDAQQANAADRAHWENQHGNTDVITDQVGAAYRRSAVGGWNGIYRKQYMGIFNESESDFIKSSLSAGYSHFASRSARSGMDTSERATKLIRNEEIVVQSPGYDHAPFVDRNELVAAREAMMEAEAALYLSAEEYDPDQAARIAAGESARRWKLEREAAAFAALLDARDTEAKNAAKSFVAKVWQAYAAHDEIFQFGRTDSKKAEDIAASVSAPGKPVTADDRGDAVSFRSSRGGLTVNAADTANPYISASGAGSKGAKQGGGAQLYAAALDWIHNNEKTVRDDPAGLTAINAIRRTSNFLASAIRWGTTAHLKPHTAQNVGKWTRSDVLNTSLLATKEMENAFKAVPSAKGWRFDFRSGRFLDANATELTEKEIEDAVTAGDPDNSGIGFSTLQRAVITASAIEAFQRGETADTLEAAERFLPDSLTGISYSLSHRSIIRLEEAIARKMTQGPEERAAVYERMRNRLAARVLMLRETKRHTAVLQTEAERERNRIETGLAEAQAIIAALPPEVRGRVTFPVTNVMAADTERGQVNALLRLIDEADSALEKVLLKEYQEAYETLLDLAKPDLRQNKTLRGRLTPEAQRLIALVQEAVVMDEATLAAQIVGAEAAIATIEAETPQTPDEIKDAQQRLIAASQWLHILTTHGALATLDAARTAAAYENLLGIYTTARTTRRILDEAKKAELMAARQEVIDSLPATDQAKHASRVNDDGRIDLIKSFGLSMVSFHQAMEWFFPKSATARKLQDQVRAADRAFTRAKIDARDRFAAFADAAWNITGKAKTWQRNRILADLSTARADWNVQLTEGIGTTEEKLTEAQADAILAGKMKTGWETDRIALISLQQALADFRLQRLKVQREQQEYAALTPEQKKHAKRVYPFSSTVIRFKRITSRGTPGPLLMSDLEVLYILQLWAQEEYQPALDKYGFTEAVVTTLQGKLNPKAEQLGDFLRTEYDAEWDRLNPVYRNRFGMDMPKIRNYAPGQFQHAQAQAGGTMTPAGAAPPVNAMAAGFTKARTHHLARPEKSNAMAAYWSHLEATEYFIAFSDILTDARTVFRTPEVRRRLESAYGTKATALFHQWLDALELDGNFKAADTLAQKTIVANLLNTQSAVGLAYNIGVLFKQAGATMGAMLEMKTTEALHGVAALARDPSGWTAVWNSEAIRQRVAAGMSPEDRQLLAASAESPSAILHALAIGRLPIAYADAVFTTAGAAVAYSHHRAAAAKEGLAPEQAHAHALAVASRIIERTAQPATPQDKSMAELSFGLLGRLLFMFKSDPRQKMAIVGMAAAQYARGDIKAPELFRKFFWGWFVYGIANELMTDAFQAITRDDDDPDRWSWKDYLAGGLAGPLNALPFYGTVFGYAASKILGTKGYSNSLNPLDRAAEDSIRLTRKIAEAFGDGKELTVQNYMTMSQQFAASLAILAGGLDSRLAILPASLRVLRDSWGVLLNTADAALPDSPETVAARIVAETEATEATASKENTRALNALANELAKLPTPARTARLASMDRDTREAVTRRLRKSLMTPSEQALANLSKASRAAAVAKILAALPESARERHLQRLKDLGLAP